MSETSQPSTSSAKVAEDLAFLRDLAEAARNTPFRGGDYLIAAGGWFALASLVVWFGAQGVFGPSRSLAHFAFPICGLGFACTLAYLMRRDRGRVETAANRALGMGWAAIGWSIFAFCAGAVVMAYRGQPFVLNTITMFVVSVYGIGWALAATITRQGWMSVTAFLIFLTVPVFGALAGTGQEFLAYGIALILIAVLPGFRLRAAAHTPATART
ncbi:MAG: hypothetical protein ING09_10715 [Roseomonas sp.]|nr:hypothetical protein [Roseomonas sp.]MCA3289016.1 hypothetical protein [Roseomonas sp.]MCA3293612.1 hypothetical protein [Roseomonas sp.]